MDKRKLLSGSSLFCELSPDELDTLAAVAEPRRFEARQIIIEQGSRGTEMYALWHGKLKVARNTDDGREVTLAILEAGDVFGELAMLDGGARTATVETLEACELLILRRNDVIGFLENHPKVMRQLIQELCARLRSVDEKVQDTLFLPLAPRLGKALKALAEQHGDASGNGIRIDLKLTQQEIANLVGASRESVNKQLNAWQEAGMVQMEGGYIALLMPEQLPG
jgi:CRP-like cAMP-binding protein